jgi:hypothetical protein
MINGAMTESDPNGQTQLQLEREVETTLVDMERRGPSIEEAEVAEFEKQIGHSLPEDYRRFLLQLNGGRLAAKNTSYPDGIVNLLLSLRNADHPVADLLTRVTRMRPSLLSSDLLPIGWDDGGGPILLALAGEHRGQVWLEDTNDARPEDSNPRVEWFKRRDMKKLADSFEQFLRSLQPLDSPASDTHSAQEDA